MFTLNESSFSLSLVLIIVLSLLTLHDFKFKYGVFLVPGYFLLRVLMRGVVAQGFVRQGYDLEVESSSPQWPPCSVSLCSWEHNSHSAFLQP